MKYFIYNLNCNSVYVCKDLEDLIKWFAYHNSHNYFGKNGNNALEDVAMNFNDVHVSHILDHYKIQRTKRNIMVVDSYNRIIDPRQFKDQIYNYTFKYVDRKKKVNYIFRRDPVPGTRKGKWHRGSYLRHPQTFQERKLSCDIEIKEFINPNRNMMNLPSSYDDIRRNKDHSWKAKKIKKQWMKYMK